MISVAAALRSAAAHGVLGRNHADVIRGSERR